MLLNAARWRYSRISNHWVEKYDLFWTRLNKLFYGQMHLSTTGTTSTRDNGYENVSGNNVMFKTKKMGE